MRFSTTVTALWASDEDRESRLREHGFIDVIERLQVIRKPQLGNRRALRLISCNRPWRSGLPPCSWRGRDQDDGVVAGAFALVAQLIEDVGFARRQVGDPIGCGVGYIIRPTASAETSSASTDSHFEARARPKPPLCFKQSIIRPCA
jgi:hypothetical protein